MIKINDVYTVLLDTCSRGLPCSNRIILGILWTGVMSSSASVWREHSGFDSFACSIIIMHKLFSHPKKSTAGNLPRSKPHAGRP